MDRGSRRAAANRGSGVSSPVRIGLALAAVIATMMASVWLGGTSLAADGVRSALSVVTGGTHVAYDAAPQTTGSQCQVAVPCTFTVDPAPGIQHLQATASTSGIVHVTPRSFDSPVTLTYSVLNTCTNTVGAGISVSFNDDVIPAGLNSTGFTTTAAGAAAGVYTVTLNGTAGSMTQSGALSVVVGTGC